MICIINCGTNCLQQIKTIISELGYPFKVIELNDIKKTNFELFTRVVISGASILLTEVNLTEYLDMFSFIKTIKIPILGICLGHQIIGLLYGSTIKKEEFVNKEEKITVMNKNFLFKHIKNNSFFHEEHSEYISLPRGFVLLAKSVSCENESMKQVGKDVYGVQFHPEMSGVNGKKIFNNFLNSCSR